jgi:hypothetical protein
MILDISLDRLITTTTASFGNSNVRGSYAIPSGKQSVALRRIVKQSSSGIACSGWPWRYRHYRPLKHRSLITSRDITSLKIWISAALLWEPQVFQKRFFFVGVFVCLSVCLFVCCSNTQKKLKSPMAIINRKPQCNASFSWYYCVDHCRKKKLPLITIPCLLRCLCTTLRNVSNV